MQLNTPKAIELGRQVHRAFGSWQKAREAAVVTADGTYRIDRDHPALITSMDRPTPDE
jgi:hypothetical protein